MEITCKICGATVSKRQSLAFEDGRVCRTHTTEIEARKKEKDERVEKLKSKIIFNVLGDMAAEGKSLSSRPNKYEIQIFNSLLSAEQKKLDTKNEVVISTIFYGTFEYNRILKNLKVSVSRQALNDSEILSGLYNRGNLKVCIEQELYGQVCDILTELWNDLDVSDDKNAFTAKELLDAIIIDASLSIQADSEEYNTILTKITKTGPVDRQLAAAGTILAVIDLMNRHKNKTA